MFRVAKLGGFAMALIAGCLVMTSGPAQAKTYNPCSLNSDVRNNKLKNNQAVVIRGILAIDKQFDDSLLVLRHEKGGCDLVIFGTKREEQEAMRCGVGNRVTIIGRVILASGLPALDPAQTSCSSKKTAAKRQGAARASSHVPVPMFDIRLSYSPRALARLRSLGESVVISTMYEGEPKPEFMREASEDNGLINLYFADHIVSPEDWGIRIDADRIPRKKLNWIKNPDYDLLVNIFTARKAHENNLITCDPLISGKISEIKARRHTVHCKLIGEM